MFVATKCDVCFFPLEDVLTIHGHLSRLSDVAIQPQDPGMPWVCGLL